MVGVSNTSPRILAIEFVGLGIQTQPGALEHMADQAVTVGVQTAARHGEDDVALADPVCTQDLVGLDDADAGGSQVIVVSGHQTGVFRGLAADDRTAGKFAARWRCRRRCRR